MSDLQERSGAAGGALPPEGAAEPEAQSQERLMELAKGVDDAVREASDQTAGGMRRAFQLKEAVEAFHKEGLGRILAVIGEHPNANEILKGIAADPFAQALVNMHGLMRPGIDARILEGLVDARPWLREHGGDVEFVAREGNVVKVRLSGSCSDCTLAPLTLREAVFNAVKRKAPEIERIELDESQPPAASSHAHPEPEKIVIEHPGEGWEPGPAIDEIPDGANMRFDSSKESILIHRSGDDFRAWYNRCPHQGFALDGGLHDLNEAGELTCPWHGWRFDLGSGDCVHLGDARLVPVPLILRGGTVWLRP